jgi:hypothetical protein
MSGNLLVGIATAIVAVILLFGLYSMWRGGDYARSNSNKLMRLRIIAQFAAIVVIMAVLYYSGR